MGKRKVNFGKMLSFRLPEDVANSWTEAAKKSEMSLTDFIRSQVKVDGVDSLAPRRKTPVPKVRYTKVDPAIVRELAKIGNNLNQLSRWANTYKTGADAVQVLQVLAGIEHEIKAAMDAH